MPRWFWLAGIVAVLMVLAWAVCRIQRASFIRQLEQELRKLRQSGEPTTIGELIPPVPPQQDGTHLYQLAIAQLETSKKQLPQPVWDSVYEFISRQPAKPFKLDDVQRTLQAAQPALQTLREALNFPHMRMTDWSVEDPLSVIFPHFSKFREFARLLVAEGKWRKREGDIDGAVESQITALKLVRRIGDEPSLIGFLVQGAIFAIAFGGLRQILSDADASPKTYQALMSELQAWDIDRDFLQALRSDRVFVIATCEWMRRKASRRMTPELVEGELKVNLAIFLKDKSSLVAQNELKALRHLNAVIDIARKGEPYDWNAIKQLEEQWEQEVAGPVKSMNLMGMELIWDEKAIAKALVPTYSKIFHRAASFHAMQRISQTAVALRLYRHEHGRYPETLEELVPKYLRSVPVDPFDGKPLRYKRLQNGFKVWSVGENMKDEGGVEGERRWIEGDIVWKAVK